MIKRALFQFINKIPGTLTLTAGAWALVKQDNSKLYDLRKAQRRESWRLKTNTIRFAIVFTSILGLFGLAFCFIPREIVDKYSGILGFIEFGKGDAQAMISDILASSATIIGLSFVVIGFSFEVVKEKTSQTLEWIFRDTRLYYVFAVSIISILLLVIMTAIKHTVTTYIAGNFAILSCWLLLATTVSIAYMFGKVITYFDQQKLVKIKRLQLYKLAKFKLLKDAHVLATQHVYAQKLVRIGLTQRSVFLPTTSDEVVLRTRNKKTVQLQDIFFPLFMMMVKRIHGRSGVGSSGFHSLKHESFLNTNHPLFYFDASVKINKLEQWLIGSSLCTGPVNITAEFEKLKETLQERMIHAAETGNKKEAIEALGDINRLYEIYREA